MRNTLKVWQFIRDGLDRGKTLCLLYVLDSIGSSPGRQGFCMAVDNAGGMAGSIGGGPMEHRLTGLALSMLSQSSSVPGAGGETALLKRQVHAQTGDDSASGMICSGEQTVFIYPVSGGAKDRLTVRAVCEFLESMESETGTELPGSGPPVSASESGGPKRRHGVLRLSPEGMAFDGKGDLPEACRYRGPAAGDSPGLLNQADSQEWLYEERLGHKDRLYIVGGGHCSLAFSQIARNLDFYVEVIDNRLGLNTLENNLYAHRKRVVGDYSELRELVAGGEDAYVVVMTFGYKSDDVAVRAIMDKDFKYFGLLGSRKKIETMFAAYTAEGIPLERMRRIHAPVGVPIKSRTPEEIAVSIAAEIIGVRNRFLP